MNLKTTRFVELRRSWPESGRHILAQYDEKSVVVYQAFEPAVAQAAVASQRFTDGFSYSRMSWIKPNFLWMMYRSGWASKPGQERVLAVWLPRHFFDSLLSRAVASTLGASQFDSNETWRAALKRSEVRLQWDPDHLPEGEKADRRAIQLGLRGAALREYGQEQVIRIDDITDFVSSQRSNARAPYDQLLVPFEAVYTPTSEPARSAVHLDSWAPVG